MARLPTLKQSQMDDRQKQVYDVIAKALEEMCARPTGDLASPG